VRHLTGCSIPYAGLATSFGMGEMMAALMFTGAICARHPDLRVVFTESSVGWAATWLPFLDEKWEAVEIRGYPVAEHPPSWYFAQQCYISGDGGDRGFRQVVDAGLTDCLLAASDFPHPESPDFPHAIDKFFDREHSGLDDEALRKIFWDNPSRLYGIE
jgi:predicted TIM-barrel fold metal-dependent hydrolase